MKTAHDTWLIYQRSLMLTLRNPVWVFVGLTQPIFFLLLFGPLLKGLAGQAGLSESSASCPGCSSRPPSSAPRSWGSG